VFGSTGEHPETLELKAAPRFRIGADSTRVFVLCDTWLDTTPCLVWKKSELATAVRLSQASNLLARSQKLEAVFGGCLHRSDQPCGTAGAEPASHSGPERNALQVVGH